MDQSLDPNKHYKFKYDSKAIRERMRDVLEKFANEVIKLLNQTTQTWKGDRPVFVKRYTQTAQSIGFLVAVEGTDEAIAKFQWLNDGTSVRWAVMSPNWQSKTTPESLSSEPGAGYVRMRGRMRMQKHGIPAKPGILPRNWMEEVGYKLEGLFEKKIEEMMTELAVGILEIA